MAAILQMLTVEEIVQFSVLAETTFRQAYSGQISKADLEQFIASQFSTEAIRAAMETASIQVLLIDQNSSGYYWLNPSTFPPAIKVDGMPMEIQRLYLLEEVRGRGYGRFLLRSCESIARERQHDLLWLKVWDQNDRAISFYRASGFDVISECTFECGSRLCNDLIMAKRI